ncbi:MAG: J domain-containing protein [Butyrivibrio sp.]|nr:J domain-containing protein [Butyrivibrio sp.]
MSDPYKVLGINREASDDEVKKAYRALSRKYHPDANINNPNKEKAEEMFKLVQQAYTQIMDEREKGYSSSSGGYGNSSAGYGGFGGFGGFNGNYNQGQASSDDEETVRLRAAANYIQSGHYREALNVLDSINTHSGNWYYYSAIANSGIGNNITAMEHAQAAVNSDPYNANYRELLNRLQNGGSWYTSMRMPYGNVYNMDTRACGRLCLNLLICNLCCGGGGICCI